jgi:hypothetical protein
MNTNGTLISRWRIDLLSIGLVAFAGLMTSLTQGGDSAADEQTAVTLMQRAHDGRAVWSEFSGFRAKVRASVDGSTVNGTLLVSSTGGVTLEIPQDERFAWVNGSLKSLVGHRLSDSDAIKTVAFADDQVALPLGRLLKSTDDSDKSLWRVPGDLLTEVHRLNGKTRFVIRVTDIVRNAERKHLPKTFDVTTWEVASNQIKSTRQVYNEWTRVGHTDLPVRFLTAVSKDDGSRHVEQIEMSDHELLPVGSGATGTR